jgi:hypothetical protein
LSEAQLGDTAAAGAIDPTLWSEAEAALLSTVDALVDRKKLTAVEFAALQVLFRNRTDPRDHPARRLLHRRVDDLRRPRP